MAGTIVVDRIESDASYASTINVAGQITFSNTVNFGAYSGTAPVAGFYLPTTSNLAFTTASAERMRINNNGDVGIGTTSFSVNNKLYVQLSSATAYSSGISGNGLTIYNNSATTGQFVGLTFLGEPTTGNSGQATILGTTTGSGSMDLTFSTRASSTLAERMRINSLGYVTQPSQSYAQLIYSDATGILRGNLVPWSGIRVNRNSAYNASTKLFTAPVAGIYFVSWSSVRNQGYTAGTGDSLAILKNGTAYVSSYYCSTVVGTVECAANDTIGFYYNNDSGTVYLRESYASIWLLG